MELFTPHCQVLVEPPCKHKLPMKATGSIRPSWQSIKNTLAEQTAVGALLGGGLAAGGFLRVRLVCEGSLVGGLTDLSPLPSGIYHKQRRQQCLRYILLVVFDRPDVCCIGNSSSFHPCKGRGGPRKCRDKHSGADGHSRCRHHVHNVQLHLRTVCE